MFKVGTNSVNQFSKNFVYVMDSIIYINKQTEYLC